MDWLTKRPIAHRGLHKGFSIPENSCIAFEHALNNNYAIELDVRVTKDNKVVVFHDKNLIRVCAVKKKIATHNYSYLKNIKLYETNQHIPLLSDILDLVNGKVPLLIEIKNYGKIGHFEECVSKELDSYSGEFAICSFNPHVITWFKSNRTHFVRGLIFGDIKKFQIKFYKIVFLYRVIKTRPHFISLDYKLLDTLLPSFARLFNKVLVCWTVNSKKKYKKAKEITDNVVFENIKI